MQSTLTIDRPDKLWNRFFVLILLQCTFMGMCTQLFNSSAALLTSALNSSATQRALYLAAFPVAALIARLFIGNIVERVSRRSLILFGLALMFSMTSSFVFLRIMSILIVFRFVMGIGFCICQTAGSVATADIVGRERLGEGLGYYQLAMSIQTALMPSVSVYYSERGNFTPIFILASGALLASFVSIFLCTYEKRYPGIVPPPTTSASIADDPGSGYRADNKLTHLWMFFEKRAMPSTMINIIYQIGGSIVTNYLLLFAKEAGIPGAGLFFTMQAVSLFMVRVITGKFIDRYGSFVVYVPGCFAGMISLGLVILSPQNPILYYLAGILFGIALGLVTPSMNTAAIRCCPESRRSIAASTYMLSNDVGIGAGGFIWSFVISAAGYTTMFVSGIACMAVSLLCATWFFKVKMKGIKV